MITKGYLTLDKNLTAMNERICVVLIQYKHFQDLNPNELASFKQTLKVFSDRDIFIVCPKPLLSEYCSFARCYPLNKDSLSYADYNNLCKSAEFYRPFEQLGYRYMCLTQLDVWTFRDDLDYFLDIFDRDNLDYIGAPWAGVHFCKDGTVGNGGFCIRRLETFRSICENNPRGGGNEDVYFLSTHKDKIRVSDTRLAAEFSWEEKPLFWYRCMKGRMPMGCHAYASTPDRISFWKNYIQPLYEIKAKAGNPDIYDNPIFRKQFIENSE